MIIFIAIIMCIDAYVKTTEGGREGKGRRERGGGRHT
jgi:hypothetical protein